MKSGQYHFIGIGGIGMSGLARILLKQNHSITGSDQMNSPIVEELIQRGVKVDIGHFSTQVPEGATVVYSSAIDNENPEMRQAVERKCPLLHRAELLTQLTKGYKTLAVTGSHGKTTVSALLASVLIKAELDPSYSIGGMLIEYQSNAEGGKGPYFVLEADESDGSFLKYHVNGAIVTNIDNDHLEHYGSMHHLKNDFQTFMKKVQDPNLLFWCGDDQALADLKMPGISYGFAETCLLRCSKYSQQGWKVVFDAEFEGKKYPNIEIALIGPHHALNALAVFGMCIKLGVPEEKIRFAFKTFEGVGRRCEKKGDANQILIIDDYAHHPTEIRSILSAIRNAIGERRLITVFQPHRYSRTLSCQQEYANAFDEADLLFMTDIYAGPGEKPIEGVSSQLILDRICQCSNVPNRYIPMHHLADRLLEEVKPHDVVLTLSAGDLPAIAEKLAAKLQFTPKKLVLGVICGGKSPEHKVALASAKYVIDSLDPSLYEIHLFGITQSGRWIYGDETLSWLEKHYGQTENPTHFVQEDIFKQLQNCELFIPVLHGPCGEDGMVQGFLETIGKAYVGCDFRSAALCMDKGLTKRIAQSYGIQTAPFIDFDLYTWKQTSPTVLQDIHRQLHYPLFVKPVHLGSSVGISKVGSQDQLEEAIEFAFKYDTHVLVEQGVVGREIEFAVMGNGQVEVTQPGEICTKGKVYDYESKYGVNCAEVHPKANLPIQAVVEGQKLAELIYRGAGCTGLARVDFFLNEQGQFLFSEINPIPGFTQKSLYPQMWLKHGLSSYQLLSRLIILGLQKKRLQERHSCPLMEDKNDAFIS